ncbi:MAG: hypothetical protein ACYDAG_03035 [Chloroflexota bacterium]
MQVVWKTFTVGEPTTEAAELPEAPVPEAPLPEALDGEELAFDVVEGGELAPTLPDGEPALDEVAPPDEGDVVVEVDAVPAGPNDTVPTASGVPNGGRGSIPR